MGKTKAGTREGKLPEAPPPLDYTEAVLQDFISIPRAAKLLRTAEEILRDAAARGEFKLYSLNKHTDHPKYRVSASEVAAWLRTQVVIPRGKARDEAIRRIDERIAASREDARARRAARREGGA